MKIAQIAHAVGGVDWQGDDQLELLRVASLAAATPQDLSFAASVEHLEPARASRAGALLVPMDFPELGRARIRVASPLLALARALELLHPAQRPAPGIHATACIDASAVIGPEAHVGAYVVIGPGCRLGARAVLHPHVVLYAGVEAGDDLLVHAHAVIREGTRLGHGVILQPGVVLGGDGFGFTADGDRQCKIPQVGSVRIGDGVEIQANSCVDRATLDQTVIGDGTKLDNLVHIGHNSRLDANVLVCAQAGLAGSTVIEHNCILAGQAGVAGHCTVGARAIITAQSGTHGDLEGGRMYSGSPAFEHRQWLRTMALLPRLPELVRQWRRGRAAGSD